MTTKVTLTAVVTVNFLARVPTFALRQLESADERMPVTVEFRIDSLAWPNEHLQIGCDNVDDVITFVRAMAKEELKRRDETFVKQAAGAVDPEVTNQGTPSTRVEP